MKALAHLSDGYALLLSLRDDHGYHVGADADSRRQAVLALPAIIRAHGLAAVSRVCDTRGTTTGAKAEQRMLAALVTALIKHTDEVAPDTPGYVARRTRTALHILDAAAALLDGVIPKPVAVIPTEPDGVIRPAQEAPHA